MKDDEIIVSGFGSDRDDGSLLKVDFATAKKLGRSGSTCDAYECTIQRRRVFVKRLKTEYRDNPFYRAAFDKEYDLGVSLSHPSLPRYAGFGDDYIIMDFIEGDTLADLIRRGDSRLKDERFCRKILYELVDVVDYLHYRNIVHCDIKADNIMIPPYADRAVTLIDFDKAYTSWLDSTPGDPAKYECDDCADGKIDFCGIGRIAGMLGQKRVAAVCQDKDAAIGDIRKTLSRAGERRWLRNRSIVICMAAVGVAVGIVVLMKGFKLDDTSAPPVSQAVIPADTVMEERPVEYAPIIEKQEEKLWKVAESASDTPADVSGELELTVDRYYGPLARRHDYLRKLAADPKSTVAQLRQVIASYAADQTKAQNQIISDVTGLYGLGNPLEAVVILATCDAWNRFMEHDTEINRVYCREIEKRIQEETRSGTDTAPVMPVQTDSLSQ